MLVRIATVAVVFAGVLSCSEVHAANAAAEVETSGTAGIVLDPEGNPVAGERVQIYLLTKPEMEVSDRVPNQVIRTIQPVQSLVSRETEADGRFTVSPLAKGKGLLSVNVKPYAQKLFPVTLPDQDIRVQLENNGGTVQGTVRNASTGQPVPNARVTATPGMPVEIELEPGKPSQYSLMGQFMRAETDASGHFTIDRLPPGTTVTLDAAGNDLFSISESPSDYAVVVNAGETVTAPELEIYPGHILTGHVTDKETGQAIPDAQVAVGFGGDSNTVYSVASGKKLHPGMTDKNGKYSLSPLKPWKGGIKELADDDNVDFMFVTATAPGYRDARFTPTAPRQFDASSLTLHHDFELQPRQR